MLASCRTVCYRLQTLQSFAGADADESRTHQQQMSSKGRVGGDLGKEAGGGVGGEGGRDCIPIVVWVVGVVAALNPLKPVTQLLLIQLEFPNHACLLVQV